MHPQHFGEDDYRFKGKFKKEPLKTEADPCVPRATPSLKLLKSTTHSEILTTIRANIGVQSIISLKVGYSDRVHYHCTTNLFLMESAVSNNLILPGALNLIVWRFEG